MSIIDSIKQRKSIRSYSAKPIAPDRLDEIDSLVEAIKSGPFGSKVRFERVDVKGAGTSTLKGFGTYGMISGARCFIAGAVEEGPKASEDFGYCMEGIILTLTELGLGTCWLGGTFKRSSFAKKINVRPNEIIPAITPIGYPFVKLTLRENMIRFMVGSKNRKPFEDIFYTTSSTTPLSKTDAGPYSMALECVRLAPSASNKQPWRVIKEAKQSIFHFYILEDQRYTSHFKEFNIQKVDSGIAMYHFEKVARETGLTGSWTQRSPEVSAVGLTYCATWIGNG